VLGQVGPNARRGKKGNKVRLPTVVWDTLTSGRGREPYPLGEKPSPNKILGARDHYVATGRQERGDTGGGARQKHRSEKKELITGRKTICSPPPGKRALKEGGK